MIVSKLLGLIAMIWLPLVTALVVAISILLLQGWQRRRRADNAKIYRARFVQLVAQLDTVSRTANQLEMLARTVREPKLLDYYEGCLKLLENLLHAVTKLQRFGTEPAALDAAFFLVKDLRGRIGRSQQAFQDAMRGRQIRWDELYAANVAKSSSFPLPTGCYFCSRPVIVDRFAKVKVRLDGQVREVVSCRICREELETTKKVKVLYFMKNGRPVHWSDVKDYSPSEDFWNINKREPLRKTTKLELIYSKPSQSLD